MIWGCPYGFPDNSGSRIINEMRHAPGTSRPLMSYWRPLIRARNRVSGRTQESLPPTAFPLCFFCALICSRFGSVFGLTVFISRGIVCSARSVLSVTSPTGGHDTFCFFLSICFFCFFCFLCHRKYISCLSYPVCGHRTALSTVLTANNVVSLWRSFVTTESVFL